MSKDLLKLGWTESFAEPGLWKYTDPETKEISATLTVYVDDLCLLGKTDELVDKLVK